MQQGISCALKMSSCSYWNIHWKIPFPCLHRRTSMSALVGIVSIKVTHASGNVHLGKVQEAPSHIITFHVSKVLPVTPTLWKSTGCLTTVSARSADRLHHDVCTFLWLSIVHKWFVTMAMSCRGAVHLLSLGLICMARAQALRWGWWNFTLQRVTSCVA